MGTSFSPGSSGETRDTPSHWDPYVPPAPQQGTQTTPQPGTLGTPPSSHREPRHPAPPPPRELRCPLPSRKPRCLAPPGNTPIDSPRSEHCTTRRWQWQPKGQWPEGGGSPNSSRPRSGAPEVGKSPEASSSSPGPSAGTSSSEKSRKPCCSKGGTSPSPSAPVGHSSTSSSRGTMVTCVAQEGS